MYFYNLKYQIGCVVGILFGISHLLSAANLSDFPVITVDKWKLHPIKFESGELNDIVFADDILVAAGKNGQLYTLQNETLTKIETPVSLNLNTIYCINPSEILVAGEDGCVLFYDGKTVEQIGNPVTTISLLSRYEDKWDAPVNLLYITANSKDDVFVAGTPSVLLHFDGREWQHIDLGQKEFYIPDRTVIGHHYVYSSIGPIWQTYKNQIYVVKGDPPNIVDFNDNDRPGMPVMGHSHRPSEFSDILLRPSILCVEQVRPTRESFGMGMGGARPSKEMDSKIEYKYFYTNIAFPIESSNHAGLFISPHVQKSKDKHYTRFNNAIYRFGERGWNLSHKLPYLFDNVKWSHWAINHNDDVLIQDPFNNYWMLNHEGSWYQIESMPELLKKFCTKKIVLNDKGYFATILPQGILTGKINLPKSK